MVVLTLSVSCYTISVRKVFLGPPIQDLASQPHAFFMFNLKSGFRRLEAKGEQHYGNTPFMESYVQEKCTKSASRANL